MTPLELYNDYKSGHIWENIAYGILNKPPGFDLYNSGAWVGYGVTVWSQDAAWDVYISKMTCVPSWQCEPGQTGWEIDGCGNRRANTICNPAGGCIPSWRCDQPLNGYENDGCGNRRVNTICNPTGGCIPSWKCETPLNGYENDGCGNRRANPACNPPQTGNISFVSSPPGSEIYIDGADQNIKTPATIYNIPVGPHIYTLKQTGYNDVTGTANVGLNQTAVASATLIPVAMPGIGTGTIMAVVLATGILGAVVYASRKRR